MAVGWLEEQEECESECELDYDPIPSLNSIRTYHNPSPLANVTLPSLGRIPHSYFWNKLNGSIGTLVASVSPIRKPRVPVEYNVK